MILVKLTVPHAECNYQFLSTAHQLHDADNEDLIMILQAAIQSNSGLASKLFITLTEGCGYDKICTFASVPARKTDYQAYLRKALKILNDMLLLKNMPADFPAEKI